MTFMEINWKYAGKPVHSFNKLLELYKPNEFSSPMRSTVPLLAYWRLPEYRIQELTNELGFTVGDSISLDFEHEVPVARGRGKPSCTDLKLKSSDIAMCIEAKFQEPRYEDVTSWLGPGSFNRREVLQGWLGLLNGYSKRNIGVNDILNLPYQLIHRAASAYSEHGIKNRWLIYQLFNLDSKKTSMYLKDLRELATLLGRNSDLQICLIESCISPTPNWTKLKRRWENGERNLSKEVLNGLGVGNLLEAQLENVIIIS